MTQPVTTTQVPTPLKQGVKKTGVKGGNDTKVPVVRKPPMPKPRGK